MDSRLDIDAGICGFHTQGMVSSKDSQHVNFQIESDCSKILELLQHIAKLEPMDAYSEIDPRNESRLLSTAQEVLTGCCAGCAVPVGLFKGMQIVAGLALPRDITIKLQNY